MRDIPRETVLRYLTDVEYHAQVFLVGNLCLLAFRPDLWPRGGWGSSYPVALVAAPITEPPRL